MGADYPCTALRWRPTCCCSGSSTCWGTSSTQSAERRCAIRFALPCGRTEKENCSKISCCILSSKRKHPGVLVKRNSNIQTGAIMLEQLSLSPARISVLLTWRNCLRILPVVDVHLDRVASMSLTWLCSLSTCWNASCLRLRSCCSWPFTYSHKARLKVQQKPSFKKINHFVHFHCLWFYCMYLSDLFGTALSLYLAHPAASVQLLAQRPQLSVSVLHAGSHLFQALHSVAVQLLPAAGLLSRLTPDHPQLLSLSPGDSCVFSECIKPVSLLQRHQNSPVHLEL